ncbi:MAG: ISKra4 family transposase [Anaerolineae bacterium]|nr:ISKra4 family transposase [Anaerolineae bacterium]
MAQWSQQMAEWVVAQPRTLEEIEQKTLAVLREGGQAFLTGLLGLCTPAYPEDAIPCSCGQTAYYQRKRPATVLTLLGTVTLNRPYYLCPSCHHGTVPLDQKLGICAGGLSGGLANALALAGVQLPFEEAAQLVSRLTGVSVCPNTVREATEGLGRVVVEKEREAVEAAWNLATPHLPPLPEEVPQRLYVSMDGTVVRTWEEGWKEMKIGAFYTTTAPPPSQRSDAWEVRAQGVSFYADFAHPEAFGRALWLEGYRRGVTQAREVVAIGDGAHWIWNLVEEHFPGAIQVVDWYHASQYIWEVAHAAWGEGGQEAQVWAEKRLDELWEGQVETVIGHCQEQAAVAGEAAHQAVTDYTHNRERMRYPEYREKGIQIGSGTVESGCRHVIGCRLKEAGMSWSVEGARAVAHLRARLKSGRWEETMAQRPPPSRTYTRHSAHPA